MHTVHYIFRIPQHVELSLEVRLYVAAVEYCNAFVNGVRLDYGSITEETECGRAGAAAHERGCDLVLGACGLHADVTVHRRAGAAARRAGAVLPTPSPASACTKTVQLCVVRALVRSGRLSKRWTVLLL